MEYITTEHEKQSLEAHVDLCALRYQNLDKRLQKLESDLGEVRKDVVEGQKSLKTTIISTAGVIIVAIVGLIGTILTLSVGK